MDLRRRSTAVKCILVIEKSQSLFGLAHLLFRHNHVVPDFAPTCPAIMRGGYSSAVRFNSNPIPLKKCVWQNCNAGWIFFSILVHPGDILDTKPEEEALLSEPCNMPSDVYLPSKHSASSNSFLLDIILSYDDISVVLLCAFMSYAREKLRTVILASLLMVHFPDPLPSNTTALSPILSNSCDWWPGSCGSP